MTLNLLMATLSINTQYKVFTGNDGAFEITTMMEANYELRDRKVLFARPIGLDYVEVHLVY